MSTIGRINSFESCGTVDGPGIRFIVFLQGCLFRCKYCHNRETWDIHTGREVTVEEIIKEANSYRHFMNASGGGITCSGGNPCCNQNLCVTFPRSESRRYSYLFRHQWLHA